MPPSAASLAVAFSVMFRAMRVFERDSSAIAAAMMESSVSIHSTAIRAMPSSPRFFIRWRSGRPTAAYTGSYCAARVCAKIAGSTAEAMLEGPVECRKIVEPPFEGQERHRDVLGGQGNEL